MRKLSFNILLYIKFSIILASTAGCEKVIHLKTDNIPAKYVIEASLSDYPGDCFVFISKSVKLSDSSIFYGVTGANVSISEAESGNIPIHLYESSSGIYTTDKITTKAGRHYTLTVDIDENHFTSTAYMPEKVKFDSLFVGDFEIFGENRKFANVTFNDPPGKGNSYRFLQFKNGVQNSNIFVMNDEYSDGKPINTFLAFFDQSDEQRIDIGDTVMVEMQCITPAIYKYFYSLAQSSTGGNEVVAPGNPVTNITGGALGYFNVFTKERKLVIVK